MENRKKHFIILIFIIIILLCIYFSADNSLRKNYREYSSFTALKDETYLLKRDLSVIRNRLSEMDEEINSIRETVFSLNDSTEAIALINTYLLNSGLTVESLNEDSFQEFEYFNGAVIDLKLSGDYSSLLKFIKIIENEKTFLEIKEIKIIKINEKKVKSEILIRAVLWK